MEENKNMQSMKGMGYKMFLVMMTTSFFIMYIVMFLNMDKLEHYHTSAARVYMALLMVAPMGVVMMLMMGKMYQIKNTTPQLLLQALLFLGLFLPLCGHKHRLVMFNT